ncbi:hypothetical protein V2H45_09465 [Tumidithrix elongata RA019]|uniref:Uncharacterized protein n=1 Tax=Tumidithrix elongata BACA0141 TaxID=2716417 RepID=A0AAW9PVP3_9CYAN|nr:hypothetical protein [Tumidithrix elongata RA019]
MKIKYTTYIRDDLLLQFKEAVQQAGMNEVQACNDAIAAYLPTLYTLGITRQAAICSVKPEAIGGKA